MHKTGEQIGESQILTSSSDKIGANNSSIGESQILTSLPQVSRAKVHPRQKEENGFQKK